MSFADIIYVLKWFLVFLAIGTAFLPLTFSLFSDLKDKGYIFSKIIGLAMLSYFVFVFATLKIFKFSEVFCFCLAICFFPD